MGSLNGTFKTLALHIKLSPKGSVRKFLYKLPCVTMTVHTVADETYSERIVPRIAEAGFVLMLPTLRDFGIIEFYAPLESRPRELGFVQTR